METLQGTGRIVFATTANLTVNTPQSFVWAGVVDLEAESTAPIPTLPPKSDWPTWLGTFLLADKVSKLVRDIYQKLNESEWIQDKLELARNIIDSWEI